MASRNGIQIKERRIMVNLDLKDRKILYQLDLNCRQSNTQIGKRVGLSREVVDYRIKRMLDEGIITSFWTAIDTYKLGYQVIRVYINFQDVSSDTKDEIIKYFVDSKNTWAVITFKGEIDFDVIFWVNDFNNFYQSWNETLVKYGKYFSRQTISTLNHVIAYKKNILLSDVKNTSDNELYRMASIGKIYQIDKIDYQILNELATNARIQLIELSDKLGLSSQAIKNRIENLVKNDIIKAFRVYIDLSKIGLQKFGLWMDLKDHSKKKKILDYFHNKSYSEYICEAVGWTDLQVEVIVENLEKLMEISEKVEKEFPNSIRKQSFVIAYKYHKERWLPEMEFK
jgi:DNA-binding Lrp family transcriptional regulator